ncbi:uncharacterized protein TNCV_2504621 [Trichonephila clavipes]|uniref:Mutator-like transposase domain-containing protein n=1 Tax=Trichonephila clavipes TaxID=2585209 RepID=A0A8X7BL09_TRICX|nr:uncharacterized protein TNCV_2504621 [Trichonephila clavipes]
MAKKRDYSSLNGCVSTISVDSGKILDIEVLSQYCRVCTKTEKTSGFSKKCVVSHFCKNHKGSASNMETVDVYRIFERSEANRSLRYTSYYGDGDSKAFNNVKDIYGYDSVVKYECIGHVQKRVGSRLRKLKKSTKGLGGKDCSHCCIFYCCSTDKKPMHGQCPSGSDTWCKYQKAKQEGKLYKHRTAGLPNAILNTVKTTYMDLCDQSLLEKCLHGKTQNANESFNGVLWSIIPKETFVELLTLKFGAFLAVLQFNDGSKGILSVLEYLHIPMGYFILKGFSKVDDERIVDSERHSLPTTKNKRKNSEDLKKGTVHYLRKRKVSRINLENFKPFQQDGTTCHAARATIDLLKDTFGDRLISRFGPVSWPPRSCDLTPLDYFLWGYVKSFVYADKPQTLDHLEDNIRRVIADIWPQMLEEVIENWTSRLDYIRASRGSPMPEIIFKM